MESVYGRNGLICFCDETETLYEFKMSAGSYVINDTSILMTGWGGNSRWLSIAGKYSLYAVSLTESETIAGVKTFSSFPVTPSSAPTTDYQVANKKFVLDNAGGSGLSGDQARFFLGIVY
jgi:hypothetical protein